MGKQRFSYWVKINTVNLHTWWNRDLVWIRKKSLFQEKEEEEFSLPLAHKVNKVFILFWDDITIFKMLAWGFYKEDIFADNIHWLFSPQDSLHLRAGP